MLCRIAQRHQQHHHSSICLKHQRRTEKLCLNARHSRRVCCCSLSSTAYRLVLTSLLVPRQSRSTAANLKSAEDRSCQQKQDDGSDDITASSIRAGEFVVVCPAKGHHRNTTSECISSVALVETNAAFSFILLS